MKFLAYVGVFIASAVLDLFFAWWAMVFLGVAHGFDGRVPALGYWATYFFIWAFGAVLSAHYASLKMNEAVADA